jgi:3-isopropylmalate/(R)-2-methylmalate dehydratase large subunit
MAGNKTLYDKLWERHEVFKQDDGSSLIYIDRHLVHEVTSPQAFEGLRIAGRPLWGAAKYIAVADHNIPTVRTPGQEIEDPLSKVQVATLEKNAKEFDINYLPIDDERQGIVHVVGPEQGAILPGMTVVCGDSHTATHGAFAALAYGIGTSQIEHVMATATLQETKAKNMLVQIDGDLPPGCYAKDLILEVIARIGSAGGVGYTIEFAGATIDKLSMEGRMTVCNMAIEAGAKSGLMAVDDKTIAYIKGRPMAPKGEIWDQAEAYFRTLKSDAGAVFDRTIRIDAKQISPRVTWGTSIDMSAFVDGRIPDPSTISDLDQRAAAMKSLDYMGLKAGTPMDEIKIDKVFIGSCTNGRIEDFRVAAAVVKGRRVSSDIKLAMVVPGSGLVKKQAESEGLDRIFVEAGFEWRQAGCSMCLAMNADRLAPGERCASTSNRNFEGRQGYKGRTHLVSPAMAAAAAINGRITDVRELLS